MVPSQPLVIAPNSFRNIIPKNCKPSDGTANKIEVGRVRLDGRVYDTLLENVLLLADSCPNRSAVGMSEEEATMEFGHLGIDGTLTLHPRWQDGKFLNAEVEVKVVGEGAYRRALWIRLAPSIRPDIIVESQLYASLFTSSERVKCFGHLRTFLTKIANGTAEVERYS